MREFGNDGLRAWYAPMMRVRVFLIVICLAVLTACSATPGGTAPGEDTTGDTTQPQSDPVGAFQVMVEWLYQTDPGLNGGRVFAIDTTQTGLPDPDALFNALKNDPLYAQHELMNTTRDKLMEAGLIKDIPTGFPDGFLIEFSDASITPDKVTAKASKWVSGTGAIFATLTARWQGGAWVLDEPEDFAIS